MSNQNTNQQERYNVIAKLDQLYQQAHQRYMAAITAGDATRIKACRLECERIRGEHKQAIDLLRHEQVQIAYQHEYADRK